MKKVLVTGGNGFIGQHLVRGLLDDGYSVRVMRNEPSPLYFFSEEEVEWWSADLKNPYQLENICKDIDTVYHLAAIPRNDMRKSWDEFHAVNISGTRLLLQQAETAKVRRFVFISTVEAAGFGDGNNPRRENDPPHPTNSYGKSKLEAEKIVRSDRFTMERIVLRLPMIYGPGTFLIVPKLFGMVRKGFYPLIGNGNNKMEFCYVGNAVHAIKLAGEKREACGELFYCSDKRSYTIREVIETIAKAMKKKVLFIPIPVWAAYTIGFIWEVCAKIFPFSPFISPFSKKPFFSRETVWWTTHDVNMVSINKIKETLGYVPPYSIEEGCRKTAEWLIDQWDQQ